MDLNHKINTAIYKFEKKSDSISDILIWCVKYDVDTYRTHTGINGHC